MSTTKKVGSPGPANTKIGGVPTMHYFDFQSRGRGQVVRLMWEVSLPPIPSFFLLPSLLPPPSLRSSAPIPINPFPPPQEYLSLR